MTATPSPMPRRTSAYVEIVGGADAWPGRYSPTTSLTMHPSRRSTPPGPSSGNRSAQVGGRASGGALGSAAIAH